MTSNSLTYSKRCLDYIKEVETLVSPARHLISDSDKPWLITGGYGETSLSLIHLGMIIPEALASQWLEARLTGIAATVKHLCIPAVLTQGQLDALVSFVYNEGATTFSVSSVRRHLIAGNIPLAADRLLVYDIAGHTHLPGLDTRRKVERSWFLEGVAVPGPVDSTRQA